MNLLSGLRIGARLGAGFGVAVVMLLLIGSLAVFQVSRVYSGTEKIANKWLPRVRILGEIKALANGVRRAALRSVLESDPAQKQVQHAERDSALTALNSALSDYQKLISSSEEKQIAGDMMKAWSGYMAADEKLLALSERGEANFVQARTLSTGESAALLTSAVRLIEQDVELNRAGAVTASVEAAANYHATTVLTCVLVATAFLSCIVASWLITRSIVIPISRAVSIAETVARGDLTSDIEASGKDETSQLLRALRHMNERLVNVVSRVRQSSQSIATGSAQIAAGNRP